LNEPPYREPPLDGSGSGALDPIEVHRDAALVVTRRDCVDYGDRGDDGCHDYFYAFGLYEVVTSATTYGARRYADEWSRVAIFLPPDLRSSIPYDDPAFATVAKYFLALGDVTSVVVLVAGDYAPLDVAALGAHTQQSRE